MSIRSEKPVIITTEKDAVKLRSILKELAEPPDRWFFVEIETEVVEGEQKLWEMIMSQFSRTAA